MLSYTQIAARLAGARGNAGKSRVVNAIVKELLSPVRDVARPREERARELLDLDNHWRTFATLNLTRFRDHLKSAAKKQVPTIYFLAWPAD